MKLLCLINQCIVMIVLGNCFIAVQCSAVSKQANKHTSKQAIDKVSVDK